MTPEFPFSLRFSSGSAIDSDKGLLRGVTVAEIGVATGHFAFVDPTGKVICAGGRDDAPKDIITTRVPLCMDERSIETVVEAGKFAVRVKVREDHDDSVGARAGFGGNFRREGNKAIFDLSVFDSYRNRGVFLEAADDTPELIGLSGDFKFTAEVREGSAYMRVVKIDAVDIVDQGALTHAGLFCAKPEIDREKRETVQPLHVMAKSNEPDLKAFKSMCEAVAAYRAENSAAAAGIDECLAALAPKPVAAPAVEPDADEMKVAAAIKADVTKELTATFSTLVASEVAKAVSAAQVEMKKQMSALGVTPTAVPAAPAPAAVPATPPEKPKDFLALKASIAQERKISATEATRVAMKEHPEVFEAYQIKLGIIKPKAA